MHAASVNWRSSSAAVAQPKRSSACSGEASSDASICPSSPAPASAVPITSAPP